MLNCDIKVPTHRKRLMKIEFKTINYPLIWMQQSTFFMFCTSKEKVVKKFASKIKERRSNRVWTNVHSDSLHQI